MEEQVTLLLNHGLQVEAKGSIRPKIALNQRIGVDTHGWIPIRLQLIGIQEKGGTETFPIDRVKDAGRGVIQATPNHVASAKAGSEGAHHLPVIVKYPTIVTVVAIRIGVPTRHAGVQGKVGDAQAHSNALGRATPAPGQGGPAATYGRLHGRCGGIQLGRIQNLDFEIGHQAGCHGETRGRRLVQAKGSHKGSPHGLAAFRRLRTDARCPVALPKVLALAQDPLLRLGQGVRTGKGLIGPNAPIAVSDLAGKLDGSLATAASAHNDRAQFRREGGPPQRAPSLLHLTKRRGTRPLTGCKDGFINAGRLGFRREMQEEAHIGQGRRLRHGGHGVGHRDAIVPGGLIGHKGPTLSCQILPYGLTVVTLQQVVHGVMNLHHGTDTGLVQKAQDVQGGILGQEGRPQGRRGFRLGDSQFRRKGWDNMRGRLVVAAAAIEAATRRLVLAVATLAFEPVQQRRGALLAGTAVATRIGRTRRRTVFRVRDGGGCIKGIP